MSETVSCPDCGQPNSPGAKHCKSCNYPIRSGGFAEPPTLDRSRAEASESVRGPGPVSFSPFAASRTASAAKRRQVQSVSLWLMLGFVSAVAVVFIAVKANVDRINQPVEGSNRTQQQQADGFAAALAQDSTDVDARIGLANLFYDTGNWSEAIGHYRQAVALDSTRTGAIVDLGVCYYNLGNSDLAEEHFMIALRRDPHQPVALFNLGIVNEARERWEDSLQYFHRAIESGPPEAMKEPLFAAIQRVAEKSGRTAPPLPDGHGHPEDG